MVFWNFYFLAKFYLFYKGHVFFHPMLNLLLFLYGIVLEPRLHIKIKNRMGKVALRSTGVLLAMALLWHDSYLPSLMWTINYLRDPVISMRPTLGFALEFLLGYWNPLEALVLGALLAACLFAGHRRLRMSWLVLPLMILPIIRAVTQSSGNPFDKDENFYEIESRRSVDFDASAKQNQPFDIILIQVCSLSWQDLRQIGLESHDFLSRFDYLLTNFNSVTAYSGPAAIRLLRACCGQTPHDALYRVAPSKCHIMDVLRTVGYKAYTVFNHEGKYSDMDDMAVKFGKAEPLLAFDDARSIEKNFDGSPIHSDYETLASWWTHRQSSGEARAALYYNSTTLHGGTRRVGDSQWWKRDRHQLYKETVQSFFGDLSRFFGLLEVSGRRVMIVFIPEHGAALVGSSIQVKGLRDIPLPQITLVPVGIKFINGPGRASGVGPRRLQAPTSYLATAYLIAEALRRPPTAWPTPYTDAALARLPQTRFLAENQHARVVARGAEYLYQDKDSRWIRLPLEALSPVAMDEKRGVK